MSIARLPEEEDVERIRARLTAGGCSSTTVRRATFDAWRQTAARIYERDLGICHPCGERVERDHYECGHIIDRCRGGSDRPSNLVVMCNVCNRLKPTHTTRSAYLDWVDVVRAEGAMWASAARA